MPLIGASFPFTSNVPKNKIIPFNDIPFETPQANDVVSGTFLDSLPDLEGIFTNPAFENKPFEKMRALVGKVIDLTESGLKAQKNAGANNPRISKELEEIKVYRSILPQIFEPLKKLSVKKPNSDPISQDLNLASFTDPIFKRFKPMTKLAPLDKTKTVKTTTLSPPPSSSAAKTKASNTPKSFSGQPKSASVVSSITLRSQPNIHAPVVFVSVPGVYEYKVFK